MSHALPLTASDSPTDAPSSIMPPPPPPQMVEGEKKYAVAAINALSNTSLSHYLHWRAELPRHVVILDPGQTLGSAMQVYPYGNA